MIKVKTNTKIIAFDGKPLKTSDTNEEILVGTFIADVLSIHSKNPARCWQLGKKFATEKEVELKAEDVVFLKEALEESATGERRFKSALAVGQIMELLDGVDEEKSK